MIEFKWILIAFAAIIVAIVFADALKAFAPRADCSCQEVEKHAP